MLHKRHIVRRFPDVHVSVPPAVVIATDSFDRFLAENNLVDFAMRAEDGTEIQQRFLAAHLPAAFLRT